MNVNRTEGCIWYTRLPEQEQRKSTETTRFMQLMAQVVEMPDGRVGKSALRQQKQSYRLVGGSMAGLICEIETREGKTFLKILVPQRDLCYQLKHFSAWLNAGLLAAGHNVVLEVVYEVDIA
ncbi:Secretion system apparatus protein ssaP [Citrobacter braakii]|uniref:Secretion system apparatus protein ssaP n=1 Tax=Citrobacter braakii TaxID=57706 RepID=UPI00142CF9FF|nr:Secretion system apparatus protein ssaP [Citrobacter braakii]ECX2001994.1 Secretion system apparatus protein ssaP [Salmonella enterica subsp. enterica serovar Newport]MBJ9048918.1 Secretion system apparatus protein ssaP [Citrobacter braakii]